MDVFQLYIDGEFCEGRSAKRFQSTNPANDEVWSEFSVTDVLDVDRAVAAAKRALDDPSWRDMSQTNRGKLLYKLADLIEEHAGTLGRLETTDSGKLLTETATQTSYVADYYRYFAGLADKIEGAVLPIDKPDMTVFTKPVPIGVVAAIVPWNAQMFLAATKIGPALAAGCTIIVKASEVAPAPMLEFAKLIDQAGFPKGVVSIITGDAENCAIPLTRHKDVDRIAFTGGTETARHVIRNSAENFAVTTMELGGKSPMIIFEDANLDSAANALVAGNFGASGQSCVAGSRALVHRSIVKEVIDRVSKIAENIIVGDPLEPTTHVGPLCTKLQVDRAVDTVAQAVRDGSTLHFGGARIGEIGNYLAPTLIECKDASAATLKVEFFAPVMSILAFDNEDEAIELANDSDFGLGSGVFTENLARAHRVSSRIRSGICWINTYRVISPIAPFGGFNQSGYGREAGMQSILDYTRTRTTWINMSSAPMANPFIMR